MAMHVDNPDPPDAAGPPMPEEYVELPEELWSATVRELDPRPVQTVFGQVRWRIARAMEELDKLADLEVDGQPLHARETWVNVKTMLMQASGDTAEQSIPGMVADVPRSLIEALIPYLREYDEPGDWSVGISPNGWCELAGELELALDGKLTCRKCGGEQYVWDEGVFLEKTAEVAKKTGEDLDEVRYDGQDYGNVTCPECGGAGVVRTREEKAS